MKFLADENVPQTIIRYLRVQGHDTVDVKRTPHRGDSDQDLLAKAAAEDRILITFDRDFVSPVYLPQNAAIVTLNFPRMQPVDVIPWVDRLLDGLKSRRLKRPYRIMLSRESLTVLPE